MRRKFKKICQICGKDYFPWKDNSKFCSYKCSRVSMKGRIPWNRGKHWSDEIRKKISIKTIGRKSYVRTEMMRKKMSEMKKGYHHTEETKRKLSKIKRGTKMPPITLECREKLSKTKIGEQNPNWRGGITPVREMIRRISKYRQWRSDIFKRDDYTCQICKIRGGYLEADHYPIKFVEILKEYQIKTIEDAISCEKLWDINNGRTLCLECHKFYIREVK